jgi:hypothetical protein
MQKGLMLLLAVLTALAFSALAGAAGSGPSTLTFDDPAGDSSGGPDITNIKVDGDAASGTITFTVTASGLPLTAADGSQREVDLWLNTDRNDSTGSPSGNEYDIYFWTASTDPTQWSWDIEHWAGTGWAEVAETPTMHAGSNGNQFALQLSTADLGGATSFSLYAIAASFDASGSVLGKDFAPDSGSWAYDIAGPTRSVVAMEMPTIGKPALVPARPTAGKRVTVSFPVTASQPGKPAGPLTTGTVVGTASIAGKAVAHTTSFHDGVAKVSFLVPKTAKGKTAKVGVRITAPSSAGTTSVWVDIATGEQGLMGTTIKGGTTTKSASFAVH